MSNTTETTPEITIRIDPVPGRGQRRVRVAVTSGENTVHLDTVQIDNARSRATFLSEVERRAESLGIAINRDNIERALLQDAMQAQPAAAAPAPNSPTAARSWKRSGSTCSVKWTISPSCAGYPTRASAGRSIAPQTGGSKKCSRRWADGP